MLPSEAAFETILMHSADAVTVQAPDGTLVYANLAAARTLGFDSPDDLLRAPLGDVLGRFQLLSELGSTLSPAALPGRRALAGEHPEPMIVRFRSANQPKDRWSLVQARPILDESGAVRMVVNTFQDVTELKRSESRLRLLADAGAVLGQSVDYEETLQQLAELLVPELAEWCVIDVAEPSRTTRRVAVAHPDPAKRRMANEALRKYPPHSGRDHNPIEEVINTGVPLVLGEISLEQMREATVDEEHFQIVRDAGVGSVAIVPLRARGQVLGALTLIASPGGHRFTENELPLLEEVARRAATAVDNARLLHEANEAIRLRDDFLAMASHDMRTPLAVILASLQLARRRLQRGADKTGEAIQHLKAAERTTQKMTGLVGELMDISVLRSGQPLPLRSEPVNLAKLVAMTADEYQRLSSEHEIHVSAEPISGIWDGTRIERVVRNLIDNALKYSPEGGRIEVVVGRERGRDGDWATVEIRDEGIGIAADEVPYLFEKFHRGSNSRELRGTGLGLAGSRAVVTQLGGTISVESTFGEGSTFRVRLPLSDGRSEPAPASTSASA